MALKGLTQTTIGSAMLNAIGRLLTANPKSEFVDKIKNLKISDKTGSNIGSETGLSDDGTTLEINLSFDEIEKNKDLYIVTDFSGQKRFIC
ncbi:MAG: hypothetical protein LBI56_01790, partial [Puniceicoccales bacterium]|nr:hypothetical protein [Puniceicoccales bacterium]